MIRIIVDNDTDLATLREVIEQGPGLPEIFYDSGYLIQREVDGHLRSEGGGGKSNTVIHYAGQPGNGLGGSGGAGGAFGGGAGGSGGSVFPGISVVIGRGGTGPDPSIPPCPECGASGGGGHGGNCPNAGR
jgi:hypothetical protein